MQNKIMRQSKRNSSTQEGFKEAKVLTKKHAKTFYFASRFLPKDKQNAAYAIYAVCRLTDDIVDNNEIFSGSIHLSAIRESIESVYNKTKLTDNILLAFRETVNKYKIPKKYFDELIEGMYMDLNKNRYESFDELCIYCERVAGMIGLIMLKVLGSHNQEAEKYAVDLGIAMQCTNILRDVKEDFERGRVYLPKDEMERFNVSENHIAEEKIDRNFIGLLKFQIERAREYYENSTKGLKMINNVVSRVVVCMMKDLYAGILNAIEEIGYNVFSRRAHVNTVGKLVIALKVLMKREYL